MKPNKSKIKLFFVVAMVFVAMFCFACIFGGINATNLASATSSANVEQVDGTTGEQTSSESAENLGQQQEEETTDNTSVDVSSFGLWSNYAEEPGGNTQNLGSVDAASKKVVCSTAAHLAWLAVQTDLGNYDSGFKGWVIELDADINLGGKIWMEIGTDNCSFKGTFIGNGHKITGVTFEAPVDNYGLFGVCDSSTKILDLIIEDFVNVTGAALDSGGTQAYAYNCYSKSLKLFNNTDRMTHCVSKGQNVNVSERGAIGLNNFYYTIEYSYRGVRSNNQNVTGVITSGVTYGNDWSGNIDFSLPTNISSEYGLTSSNVTVRTHIETFEHGKESRWAPSYLPSFYKKDVWCTRGYENGTAQFNVDKTHYYAMTQFRVTVTRGDSGYRSYSFYNSNTQIIDPSNPTSRINLGTIYYVHQNAVKIVVYLTDRLIKVKESAIYAVSDSCNYDGLAAAYTQTQDSYKSDFYETITGAKITREIDGATVGVDSSTKVLESGIKVGQTLKYSHNYNNGNTGSSRAVLAMGAIRNGGTYEGWEDEFTYLQWTVNNDTYYVGNSTGTRTSSGYYLWIDIAIYLSNVHKYNIENSNFSVNPQTGKITTAGKSIGYMVNELSDESAINQTLVHNISSVRKIDGGSDVVDGLYITNSSDLSANCVPGTTGVYEGSGSTITTGGKSLAISTKISGEDHLSVNGKIRLTSTWGSGDGGTVYCAWQLFTRTLKVENDSTNPATLAVTWINPNLAESDERARGSLSTSITNNVNFKIPATFAVTLQNTKDVDGKDLVVRAKSNTYVNRIAPGTNVILENVNSSYTLSKLTINHIVKIFVYHIDPTYTFSLKDRKIGFKIDILVKDGNNVLNTFDVIDSGESDSEKGVKFYYLHPDNYFMSWRLTYNDGCNPSSAGYLSPEYTTGSGAFNLDKFKIEWSYLENTSKMYRYSGIYNYSGKTLNRVRGDNQSVEFAFPNKDELANGEIITIQIEIVSYKAEFNDSKIYDIDSTNNTDIKHASSPQFTTGDTQQVLVLNVNFMRFNEIKLNGSKIYDIDGGTFVYKSNSVGVTPVANGIVLLLGDGSSVIIRMTDRKQDGILRGQTVTIEFSRLAYSSTNYQVDVGYDKIKYTYSATSNHYQQDCRGSYEIISGLGTSNSFNVTYKDVISYGKNAANQSNVDVTIKSNDYNSQTSSTVKISAHSYFEPSSSSLITVNVADLLSSTLKPSHEVKFYPAGVQIEIIGRDSNQPSNEYVKSSASDSVTSFGKSARSYSIKTINYYTFSNFSEKTTGNTFAGSHCSGKILCPSELKYIDLVNKYVTSGKATFYANYVPIVYSITFSDGASVNLTYADAKYNDTQTINDYLESKGYLNKFVKSGYDLTFIDQKTSKSFNLNSTIQNLITGLASPAAATGLSFTLTTHYEAKQIRFDFLLKGGVEILKNYKTRYNSDINWANVMNNLANDILKNKGAVVLSWYEESTGKTIATYQGFDYLAQTFTYKYESWKPNWYQSVYRIIAEYNDANISVVYNGAYLPDGKEAKTTVAFGTNSFKAVPTPTREGYEFAYWKMADSKGNEFKAYKLNSSENTVVVTTDKSLYFYAYWNVKQVEFNYTPYNAVYDSATHKIDVISVKTIPDMQNKLELYNKSGTKVTTATLLNGKLTYPAKYVADSGEFYAIYTYSYVASDINKPNSKYYILNNLTSTTSPNKVSVTITPKQLTIGKITKQYDASNAVTQEVVGIFDADKTVYSITSKYASVNAAKNIAVSYTVNCSNNNVKGSYSIPTTKLGDITAREIYANISGAVKYSGLDDEKILIAEGTLSDAGATITSKNAIVSFTNEIFISRLLGASRQLTFKINAKSSEAKVYDVEDFTLELKESNGSASTDFVLVILSSTFEIEPLAENERSFIFYSVIHPSHPNASTLDVADYVYSINMTGARRINELTFNIIISPIKTAGIATFNVDIDFKDENWWLNGALVVDRVSKKEQVVAVALYKDGIATFNYEVSANKNYDVYLQFTNVSKVSYELGVISTSELIFTPRETYVQYASSFTLPTPSRKGLGFNKWFYIDSNGQQTIIEQNPISWAIKGDVTLYALWTYTATITITGQNVSAAYSPSTYYTLSATNSNDTSNTYLEYNGFWKKSSTENGTYVKVEGSEKSITLHEVVDSGFYAYEFSITNIPVYLELYPSINMNVSYENNNKFSISITRKNLSLSGDINKQYDGEVDGIYEITTSNVSDTYSELVGEEVVVTYVNADVGASIVTIREIDSNSVAKNYILTANGKIIKRDVSIDIGEQEFIYTGSLIKYVYGQELLDKIKISSIEITTNSENIGEYNQANNNITITFEAVLLKNNGSVSPAFFNFIVAGSIIIDKAVMLSENVNIVWDKVYNMENQNVDVYVFGNKLTENYTVKQNGLNFTGATEADKYTDITVTIDYPNYKTYTVKSIFTINQYEVFVEITASNIYKIYDGNVKLTTLISGNNYALYTTQNKQTAVSAAHKNNIESSGMVWFEFATPTAGKDKALTIKANSTNYKFNLINRNLKAEIAKKSITLSVSNIGKIYDEKGVEIDYSYITPNTLVSGETILGKLIFNVTDANVYRLESQSLDIFAFDSIVINETPITTNYNITAVMGVVTIHKASVSVTLTPDSYTYTGTTQEIVFVATRNSDGAVVTEILEIVENNGVTVGNHNVVIKIKDEYVNNYDYTSESYLFNIVKKQISLDVNARKVYDGNVFTYYVNVHNDILCMGHTFGESTFVTVGAYANTYYSGLITKNVAIYDSTNADVTSNYNISYNVVLTIGKGILTDADIIKSTYTYNNRIQNISFEVAGDSIAFAGEKKYGISGCGCVVGEKQYTVSFARKVDATTFSVLDFKYAATYTVTIKSNIYEDFAFDLQIVPKTISSFNATTEKVYDATTDVIGEVTSDDIYAEDTKYVTLVGKHSAVFGKTLITVEFLYNRPQANDDITAEVYELIKSSYVLAQNLSMSGYITQREVIFTYVANETYYYNGQKLTLNVASKFNVENVAAGESFGGTIDFMTIINAGTYDIAKEIHSANVAGLTLNGLSLEHYKLTFVGTVVINKAKIVVQQAQNTSHIYSDERKSVELVAYIHNNCGAITNGIEKELLYAKYKSTTAGEFVTPINVGEYYIYPQLTVAFAQNYEYVGEEYLTDSKLTITKREVTVTANKEIVYDITKNTYEFKELSPTMTDIVSGHTFDGKITISKNYALGTFVYKTGEVTDGVILSDFIIENASGEVTLNYNVTYDIIIKIVETIVDGQFRAYAKQDYQYNAQNQINDIVLVFEIGANGTAEKHEIKYNKDSDYGKITGFYSTLENAENARNALSEIKVVGTYYARMLVDTNGTGKFTDTYRLAVVKIVKKVISKASLLLENVAFFGAITYFNGSTITLQSSDIYEVDRATTIITGTYYDAGGDLVVNVGSGYIIRLSLSGVGSDNYVLDTATMDGSITKRVAVVDEYNDTDIYYYKGVQTITLGAQKFGISGQVDGHTLAGNIEISVENVGEYQISAGDSNFGIVSEKGDVSSNYKIEISEALIFILSRAKVTISWSAADLIYNAQYRLAEIIDGLTFDGSYTIGTKEDVVLQFNQGILNAKDAGEYKITLATSLSGNFEYTIGSKDTIIVDKAEIIVQQVQNAVQVYSDEGKKVELTACIYNGKGAIEAGIEKALLSATYKASTAGEFVTPINVGEYYIYPQLTSEFTQNYIYSGERYLTSTKLTITRREVTVIVDKEIAYDVTKNSYEFKELSPTMSDIVSGHTFDGKITISKNYALGTFVYKTGQVTDGVILTDFIIENASGEVTLNYDVTYDIVIKIVEAVGNGQFRAYAKQDYQYNSQNQINDIVLIFEIGVNNGLESIEIKYDKSSDYSEILGYYTSLSDAENGRNSILELKNVGTYYARVAVDVNGTGTFGAECCFAIINIVQKVITKSSFIYDGEAFLGIITYFNGSTITLQSSDIYEADKESVTITATYYNSNGDLAVNVGSGYEIRLVISGASSYNYVLDTSVIDGSISKRTVVVDDYNGTDIYHYRGAQKITLAADKFGISGQVEGHILTGNIEIFVQDVGEYKINAGIANFGMLGGKGYVSSNYNIEISEDLNLAINKTQITISWTSADLIYNAQYRLAEIIDGLTIAGAYTIGSKTDVILQFNEGVLNAKDAGEYRITNATSTSGNFEYVIGAKDTILINKAAITVQQAQNTVQIYSDEGKEVELVACIYSGRGTIDVGIEKELLFAKYKSTTDGEFVTPINVGEYYIYPQLTDTFAKNYEYVGEEYLTSTKLTITKREVSVTANKEIVYDITKNTYEFKELSPTMTDIVSGHTFDGKITINKNVYDLGTFVYKTGQITDDVILTDFIIENSDGEVTFNYAVSYDIVIQIVDIVGEGQFRTYAKQDYVYNSQNQINDIVLVFEIGISNKVESLEIEYDKESNYSKILGYYTSLIDAEEDKNSTSELKDVGTYYARVAVDVNGTGTFTTEYRFAIINIIKKSITKSSLIYDGAAFLGIITYFNESTITLQSSDIYEDDKESVTITAIYYNSNGDLAVDVGSDYRVTLEISGMGCDNYELDTSVIDGSISQRVVVVDRYTDEDVYYYKGEQTIILDANKFGISGQVQGHTLFGSISLFVKNVGEYQISAGDSSFGILGEKGDVSFNYIIEISEELLFNLSRAKVTISWNNEDLIYNAQDRLTEIIEGLTIEGEYKTGVKTDILLQFNEGALNLKDAGKYNITIATSTSDNFEYTIGENHTIVINQKEASIDLGMIGVKWKAYNKDGYSINYNMVTGGYPADKALFEQGLYKIDGEHIANTYYYAEDGIDYADSGKFVKFNRIITSYPASIVNNYKIVSVVGGIEIIPENVLIKEIAPFTYNGQDRFGDLVVVYNFDDGVDRQITANDTTNGTITIIELIDAGTYNIEIDINTAIYNRPVTINPKAITSIDLVATKFYDGTQRVYNSSNSVTLYSSDVISGDDIIINGSYAEFKASDSENKITFTKTGEDSGNYTLPNNYVGKILKRPITFNFGTRTLTYNPNNIYEVEYYGTTSILGGTITSNKLVFSLKDNNVKMGLALNSQNATFDLSGFAIENNLQIVTDCYSITFEITINLDAKEFYASINGYEGNSVEYDATEKKVTISISGLSEQEENLVLSTISIVYSYATTGETLAKENHPTDADKYIATIIYSGSNNYYMAGTETYEYEITPYKYEVISSDILAFSKEYNTQDPQLVQNFTKVFEKASHSFTITYSRDAGEDIGNYNLVLDENYCSSKNIQFVCGADALVDKFTIVKNTSQAVNVTITNYNGGEFARYYGLKNIGTFNIDDFTYTTTVNAQPVQAGITQGTIIYNSGNVGLYGVNSAEITSTNFAKFEVISEIQLEIKARTLLVSATDYNKPYDGTTTFANTLNYEYNSVSLEGIVDSDDIAAFGEVVVAVNYASADVGTHSLMATLSTNINNFNVILEKTSGSIDPLEIEVLVDNEEVVYGEDILINYSVKYANDKLEQKFTAEQLKSFVSVGIFGEGKTSSSGFAVVGEYPIEASVNSNFEITNSISAKVVVIKKEVTVVVTPKIYKIQDGSAEINLSEYASVSIEGAFTTDEVNVVSAHFENASSGLEKVVIFVLGGDDSANYIAKTTTGDIGQRIITFEFIYYGYEGCAVAGSQINSATTTVKTITYDYYASINAQNPNSLPSPAFIGRGYEFIGWSLNTDGTPLVNPDEEISKYITPYQEKVVVYAIWDIQRFDISIYKATYNFEINDYDKTLISVVREYYLTTLQISDYAEDIPHYKYVGYGVGNTNKLYTTDYEIVDNATIYLVYDLNKYTVTFDANGGVFSNQSSIFSYSGASKASIEVYYGQKIGAVVAESLLENYTISTKIGYTFENWQIENINYQVSDLATYTVQDITTIIASWTANKYALTLYGKDGIFELTAEDLTAGWSYVEGSNNQNITILVAYESNIPSLPSPTKNYYAFVGYVDVLGKNWEAVDHIVWNTTEGINLYATYTDLDYTLTVLTEHSNATIVVKDLNGAIVNVENTSAETGKAIYNVKTSYSVTITANADAGYSFASFTDEGAFGIADKNTYVILSFTGNPKITVNVTANSNKITLMVNDNSFGYITATDGTNTYSSNDANPTFIAKTGEEFIVSQFASEGYVAGEWKVSGTGELFDFGQGRKAFIGFTSDATVYLEFVAKELNIQINNTPEKGYYVYLDKTYTETQIIKVKTGDRIVLRVTANYGYDVIDNAFAFETISENKGIVSVEKQDGAYIVTLSGFTSDGSITINYKTQQFTLTFGYAEFDEEAGEISPIANTSQILLVNENEQSVGDTITLDYLTQISIKPIYQKEGFKLYGYVHYQNYEFIGMLGETDINGVFTFNLDYSYNLYLVYQREIYTVTYKVNNQKHGSISREGSEEQFIEIVESVYYGRRSSAIEAKLADQYREFIGWTANGTTITTNYVISGIEILQSIEFVAEMKGTNQTFNVVVNANSPFEVSGNINSILTGTNVLIGAAGQTVDVRGNLVITIPVTYLVGNNITLELSVNDFYQVLNGGIPSDNFEFYLGQITPDNYNSSTPYVIDLCLRYYKVEVQTEAERAAIFNCNTSRSLGIGAESNFNPNGTTMLVAYVQYGGTLALTVQVQEGYTYAGQEGLRQFEMFGINATLENVTEELVIIFNFTRTQYKITFNTSYPTDCLGEPLSNVTNKEFVFYVEQDGKILKNADGSEADLTLLLDSQEFDGGVSAKFKFEGWSITLGTGTINRTYHIDPSGIYYYNGETKVYGFNFCVFMDEDGDQIPDLDANGRVQTTLYGVWSLPTYKVTIQYAPSTISFEGDYSYHLQDALGLDIHYKDGDSYITDYLLVAEGVKVAMFTTPEFDGYRYYGWKLSTDSEISTEDIEFTMLNSEISIILYYQFQVKVAVEESIANANTATINGTTEVWCIVGENLVFVATPGDGFKFDCWKLDGVNIDEFGATFTIAASDTATYTAVFEGLEVGVFLRNISHTSLELLCIAANTQTPTELVQNKVRVGDTVRIKIASVEYGYTLETISINDSVNNIIKDASGDFYDYFVTQADGVNGKIFVDSVVNPARIDVKFELNIEGAGFVMANSQDVSNLVMDYSYNENLNINVTVQPRYNLIGVSINGTPIDLSTSFVKTIHQVNGFATNKTNVITFEFEKLYWMDVRQALVGYGTKEAPYLISSAENLAYMAYIVNNGIIDQSLNRLYYKVTVDIDLSERFWIPIGTAEHPFDGTFILGKFKIIGATFAESYTELNWQEHCPKVFGYITKNAEIITEQSILRIIIIFVIIAVVILAIIFVIVTIINKRKKKLKRLSENLGVSSVKDSKPKQEAPIKTPKEIKREKMDADVEEILKEANAKKMSKTPAKPNTKVNGTNNNSIGEADTPPKDE